MEQEWFEQWFDTKYYHILYKNRDFEEAQRFIDHLIAYLEPKQDAKILDLACGKGRFSLYLAAKGFDLTGVDLSIESIEHARSFENERLHFYTHDMRLPFRKSHFHYVFNFFTSFGYFEDDEAHQETLTNVVKGLRKKGVFVLDFLNATKVAHSIKKREQKTIDGIRFIIRRKLVKGYIIKTIRFEDNGKKYRFEEKVRAFTLANFKTLFEKAGLHIVRLFGSYHLADYQEMESDRLIIVAEKKEV